MTPFPNKSSPGHTLESVVGAVDSPKIKYEDFLKPGKHFRRSLILVLILMWLFFIFYALLIAGSVTLVYYCVKLSIYLVSNWPNLWVIIGSAGLVTQSIMFFLFFVKFIFSSGDEGMSTIEIRQQAHPLFTEFIGKIAKELSAPSPEKIFLVPELNAAANVQGKFLTLFMPVKHHLLIGMGLINVLNISELKYIIAHELAHFSQKGSKLSIAVYQFNKIIANLVHERDKWDEWLERLMQTWLIFGLFIIIAGYLVLGIRMLLSLAYRIIQKQYLGLSREMEFHADLVAASISGSGVVETSMVKTEFALYCQGYTHDIMSRLIETGKKPENYFKDNQLTLDYIAGIYKLKDAEGDIDTERTSRWLNEIPSRLKYEDLWSSHPSDEERIKYLAKFKLNCRVNKNTPWELIENPADMQKQMTGMIFDNLKEKADAYYSTEEYERLLTTIYVEFKVSEMYRGFYDQRYINPVDLNEVSEEYTMDKGFDQIFNPESRKLVNQLNSNENDLVKLGMIKMKEIDCRFFEFDNVRYKRKEAETIIEKLTTEINGQREKLKKLDEQAFYFHYCQAIKQGQKQPYLEKYKLLVRVLENIFILGEFGERLNEVAAAVDDKKISETAVIRSLGKVESDFRTFLDTVDKTMMMANIEFKDQRKELQDYLENNLGYTRVTYFDALALEKLSDLFSIMYRAYELGYIKRLKELTDFQLTLL
jgi:Zn-dependent protease with chaperone function